MTLYNDVISSVEQEDGRVFALQASAGTVKTYTMILILDTIRSRALVAFDTGMSGTAASLLHNGRTFHKRANILIKIHAHSTANFTPSQEMQLAN